MKSKTKEDVMGLLDESQQRRLENKRIREEARGIIFCLFISFLLWALILTVIITQQ